MLRVGECAVADAGRDGRTQGSGTCWPLQKEPTANTMAVSACRVAAMDCKLFEQAGLLRRGENWFRVALGRDFAAATPSW